MVNEEEKEITGLCLTFIEFKLKNRNFNIHYLPKEHYPTKENYLSLKNTYSEYFFYQNDNKIYYWSKVSQPQQNISNGITITVNTQKDYKIVTKILEVSIIEFFRQKSQTTPIEYNKYSKCHYILRNEVFNKPIIGLSVRNHISISTKYFKKQSNCIYGLTISTDLSVQFILNKEDLKNNTNLVYEDLQEKEGKILANSHNIKKFLLRRYGKKTTIKELYYEDKTKSKLSSYNEENKNNLIQNFLNQESFILIKKIYGFLNKQKNNIYLPSENTFSEISLKSLPLINDIFKPEDIGSPKRYYYLERQHKYKYNGTYMGYDAQIKEYQPYDYNENSDVTNISVICPKEYEGLVGTFMQQVKNNLEQVLHIGKVEFNNIFITNDSIENYNNVLSNTGLNKSDLAIIIVNERHKNLPVIESPYYVCKAKLLGRNIVTQDIQEERLKNYNSSIINNISLNIYAKLGRTAWTIEKEQNNVKELIIGIGSARTEDKHTIFGIAQVFSNDGKFLVSDCSSLATVENYVEKLEKHIHETLLGIINSHINKQNSFRLIFHLSMLPNKKEELKALNGVIEKLKLANFDFSFCFVHLSYDHNFRLFQDEGKSEIKKGKYVKLDTYSALLHFGNGNATPLKIDIDKRTVGGIEPFIDIYYLAKQIYWFSNLSHRSYKPAKETVTIKYADAMAKIMQKLQQVKDWDKDIPSFDKRIMEKAWFI